jgi:hypothetical protein
MNSPTFFDEFKQRAGFVGAIALSNPVILSFYVLISRSGPGALEFWAAGMVLIALTCIVSLIAVAMVVRAERRKRFRAAQVRRRTDRPDAAMATAGGEAANRG